MKREPNNDRVVFYFYICLKNIDFSFNNMLSSVKFITPDPLNNYHYCC